MTKKISTFLGLLKKTFKGWSADDPFRQSAVIAYYAIFSLPALLVLIINVIGLFFEKEAINGEISRQIESVMGTATSKTVEDIVRRASEFKAGVISTIIAVVTIIIGATGVFVELQKSLNIVFDVKPGPKKTFMTEIRHRLFSFGLILSIGFLMLVSLVISSALSAFSHWLEGVFSEGVAYLLYVLDVVLSVSVTTAMFALMFHYLPDVRIRWKTLIPGAFLTAVLFILGKYALSFYFGKAEPESVYGAAGSIILVLLWVSYSSMIVFFGAEFTKQYALHKGVKPRTVNDAEFVKQDQDGKPVADAENSTTTARQKEHKVNEKGYKGEGPIVKKNMKKITSKKELEEEIAKKENLLAYREAVLKEKLKPARVVLSLLNGKSEERIPPPPTDEAELKLEAFEVAIRLINEKLLFKNSDSKLKPVSYFLMRELAKNIAYGRTSGIINDLRSALVHDKNRAVY
jgi:membrane protein